jgi:hypothetical protein
MPPELINVPPLPRMTPFPPSPLLPAPAPFPLPPAAAAPPPLPSPAPPSPPLPPLPPVMLDLLVDVVVTTTLWAPPPPPPLETSVLPLAPAPPLAPGVAPPAPPPPVPAPVVLEAPLVPHATADVSASRTPKGTAAYFPITISALTPICRADSPSRRSNSPARRHNYRVRLPGLQSRRELDNGSREFDVTPPAGQRRDRPQLRWRVVSSKSYRQLLAMNTCKWYSRAHT